MKDNMPLNKIAQEIEAELLAEGILHVCEWCGGECNNYSMVHIDPDNENYIHGGWLSTGCAELNRLAKWYADNDNS